MYNIYSQDFYNNKNNQKTNFEKDYINAIKQHPKLYKKISDKASIEFPKIRKQFKISFFPSDIDSLLKLSPMNISRIFIYSKYNTTFKNAIENLFVENIPALDKHKNQKKDETGSPLYKDDNLIAYEKFDDKIIEFFVNNSCNDIPSIKTCFYCNMAYINNFIFDIKIMKYKQSFDLDHFIAKDICSLFSLCVYNFVPSCQLCNERIKHNDITFDEIKDNYFALEKLFPSSPNYKYDKSLKFRIEHETKKIPSSYLGDNSKFHIVFDNSLNNESILYEQQEAEPFHILDRYTPHKIEFLTYMEKHIKYPPDYFISYEKMFSKNKQATDELKEAIFDIELRDKHNLIFKKIYKDLDDMF